jgi:penicillin G amidase
VAWGMTTAMIDTQDLFVERLHPEDPRSYEVDGEWVEGEVVRELIRVRGRRRPEVEEVLVTRHGPVVVPPEDGKRQGLALRWSHHEPAETTRAFLDLMVAGDVEEADRALDGFAGPPHNFVLADAGGTIGYRLAGGPIPLRRGWDGRVPAPGWTSSHDWDGFIPQADLPRMRDPERGFVVSANNRIVGDDYPYDLGAQYLSGYRARRIETLLQPAAALTSEQAGAIMLDRLSLPGLELAAIASGFESSEPLEQAALDLLREWDGDLAAESRGGAVYGALMSALERDAYADAIAEPLLETEGQSLPSGFLERSRPLLLSLLAAQDDSFFEDGQDWDDVFRRSLAAAVRRLGPDPATWRWGRLRRFRLAHAFDGVPGVGRVFSRGPFEVGGDADTVAVMAPAGGRAGGSMLGASMRAVFDLGRRDGDLISLVPGQSGHPASPHYDDLLPGWLRGELVPLALERAHVEELAEARLRLVPRPPSE